MEFQWPSVRHGGLRNLRNRRDATNLALWYTVKRARAGVKASFGDDSSQYEMFGSMVHGQDHHVSLGAGLADPLHGLDAVDNRERLAVCTDIGSKSGNNENGKYNFIEYSPHYDRLYPVTKTILLANWTRAKNPARAEDFDFWIDVR
jgi:hypothetical protein